MNQGVNPQGAKALAVIAALMAVTLLGLLTFAGLSQNGNSFVATFYGYNAAGEELWSVESYIDGRPSFRGDQVTFSTKGDGGAVTLAGEVVPYNGPQRTSQATRIAGVSYDSQGWPPVTIARDSDGAELWRAEGFSFVDAGRDVAVLRIEASPGPVASRTGRASHHIVAAQTGELLDEYNGPRNRRPVAGDGIAAYVNPGQVTTVGLDGSARFPVDNLEATARVVVVQDGIVVTDQPDAGSRLIRGFDLASGTELWSRSATSFNSYTDAGVLVAYTDEGLIDLDLRTGQLSAPWSDVVRDGVVEASAAEMVELEAPGSVRYLRHGTGTVAVDAESSRVLWSAPTRFPFKAGEGLAVHRTPDKYEFVSAATGESVATVERARGSSVAIGAGRALVESEGRVSVVGADGSVTQIAEFDVAIRAQAISERYALVIDRPQSNKNRQAVVLDTATGEEIARHEVGRVRQALIEAGRIVLYHGGDTDTVIDLTTWEVSRIATDLFEPNPTTLRALAVVFDASRQRLLWEQRLDDSSTVGTIGDVVVIIRTGSRRNGVTKYPEIGL